jgi:hypothetical protein
MINRLKAIKKGKGKNICFEFVTSKSENTRTHLIVILLFRDINSSPSTLLVYDSYSESDDEWFASTTAHSQSSSNNNNNTHIRPTLPMRAKSRGTNR